MPLLQTNDLSKQYNKEYAIKNVNFSIKDKSCIALIGPNGAGKTTILKTLAGLIKPTTGKISFSNLTADNDIRSMIGYLPQYPNFPSWMSGREFLIFSGQLANLSREAAEQRTNELLDQLELIDAADKRIKGYSGGMKQRLGIAQAIIHKPKLLMLDEPVSSLDPIGRRYVLTLMEELKKDMSILFSTHILSDAEEISDELILLQKGKIIESGSIESLKNKYQTTMIELEFTGDPIYFKNQLSSLDSILSCTINRQKLHLYVANIEIARHDILTKITNENWELIDFSINRASLEDMFMRVVKQ